MKIDIALISLDVVNFRHAPVTTEREAIRHLLEDERTHKVSELAADIVQQQGMDPSSLLIVTEDANNPGQYVALEGNRRITALKTLMTPDLAAGTPGYQKFKRLHQEFLGLNLQDVECVILDRAQAAVWIKRKHYKGMGGTGVVSWNAVATARSDASEGRHTRWMSALAYLEEQGMDAEDIRDSISSKTTTVERVLASPYMATILGLTFGKDGSVVPENGDKTAATKLIHAVLDNMTDRGFVETKVSNSDQQRDYIETFLHLHVKKPVAKKSEPGEVTSADAKTNGQSGGQAASASSKTEGARAMPTTANLPSTGPRSKPVVLRKKLAKMGLRISNGPMNRFYSELRNLSVENNPHLAAAVIRIFIEKSSALYLHELNIPPLSKKPDASWNDHSVKFREKVAAVLKEIDPSLSNPELIYARDIANGNSDKLHTADHLNQAIHSHHAIPSHSEIITIWDRLHPYLSSLFDDLEKKRATK